MTILRHGAALLMLGLCFAMGCGGTSSTFHQSHTREGCRKDAAADSVARAADAAAGDASPAVDSTSDTGSRDSEPGLDALVAEDGEGDAGASVDACDEVASPDGGRACGPSPWILVGEVPNVRQLGGVPLVRGGHVGCDLIYRGSSLASLSQNGCEQFAATGIKTVIDIRSESEQTSPAAACVAERANLVSAPLPTPYNVSPADYLADLYTAPSMRKVFAVLADRAAYPVYYHCLYGKDRTGVVTAVILSALGASRQTIQDEYALSGQAGFSFYPESLDAVLDELERVGLDAYFRNIGVPAEQVQAMRAILLAR